MLFELLGSASRRTLCSSEILWGAFASHFPPAASTTGRRSWRPATPRAQCTEMPLRHWPCSRCLSTAACSEKSGSPCFFAKACSQTSSARMNAESSTKEPEAMQASMKSGETIFVPVQTAHISFVVLLKVSATKCVTLGDHWSTKRTFRVFFKKCRCSGSKSMPVVVSTIFLAASFLVFCSFAAQASSWTAAAHSAGAGCL
mmetsp:Transcript_66817/g.159899  ORF Transcript_66817/g.159899 Transcript_66817/m.159899 type:complete len:201 (-) Transcript_66817:1121-1723(-)